MEHPDDPRSDPSTPGIDLTRTALGIEFGSTRIKAVLTDPSGAVLASGGHTWDNRLVDGVWTYSIDEVETGLRAAYAALAEDLRATRGVELTTVGAIGVSGMMHGYLPLDDRGRPLTAFRTWRNTITAESSGRPVRPVRAQHPPALVHLPPAPRRDRERGARGRHRPHHHPGGLRPLAPDRPARAGRGRGLRRLPHRRIRPLLRHGHDRRLRRRRDGPLVPGGHPARGRRGRAGGRAPDRVRRRPDPGRPHALAPVLPVRLHGPRDPRAQALRRRAHRLHVRPRGRLRHPEIPQRTLAAAFDTPVSVATTASQGGAWGMSLLAGYLLWGRGRALEDYLDREIFADARSVTITATAQEVAEYGRYLERFIAALPV